MAALSDEDRRACWAQWMRELIDDTELTKAQLRAAVDALDDFFEANASTINQAIPQPARGQLTTKQKAQLLQLVLHHRYVVA